MKVDAVPTGQRDIYEVIGDEPFENPRVEATGGGSTLRVKQTAENKAEIEVRGDGGIGGSSGDVVVDGHIGEGDVAVRISIEWDTINPDATTLSLNKLRREPIPADEAAAKT